MELNLFYYQHIHLLKNIFCHHILNYQELLTFLITFSWLNLPDNFNFSVFTKLSPSMISFLISLMLIMQLEVLKYLQSLEILFISVNFQTLSNIYSIECWSIFFHLGMNTQCLLWLHDPYGNGYAKKRSGCYTVKGPSTDVFE